ncbi:MAG: c-type cytochrome [Nitrospira sp.]|nr:c-type cytochrome [Nitrospira sp.]
MNMNRGMAIHKLAVVGVLATIAAGAGVAGCALFQNEQVAKGKNLYAHYCMHCHGEHGRQNEGYNWAKMPDPRPKDLSNKSEMSTYKDEEIFNTIWRDMKDTTPDKGDKIGDDEFAVPTMPTLKYTLSEEEVWSIVAYVRTLHGMKSEFDIAGRMKKLESEKVTAQQQFDQVKQTFEAAQKKADDEAEKSGKDTDEAVYAKEQDAFVKAKKVLDVAQAAVTNFKERPKFAAVPRPDLTMKPEQVDKLVEHGKQLYTNKYGCNACHRVGEAGGAVGPALDRAGFRLNPTWVYRWIKYPQAMKPTTRMPNLGLSDEDAKAVTLYVATLRAPKPENPIQKAGQ